MEIAGKFLLELPAPDIQLAQSNGNGSISDDEIILALRTHLKEHAVAEACSPTLGQKDIQSCFQRYGSINGKALAQCQRDMKADCEANRRVPAAEFGGNLVYSVVGKQSYEGNYVSYVNARTKGSDETSRVKLLLARRGGTWKVIELHESHE